MFSFHKPKIYRSINGCCICKAKSSSSRFTDSKKYESEFEKCFRIREKRSGEICNACVLLVKRWKKLPPGTTRDWHHVVDARAGPGTKSIKGKINSNNNNGTNLNNNNNTTTSSNHNYHNHSSQQLHSQKKKLKPKNHKISSSNNNLDDNIGCDDNISECSVLHTRIPSPTATDSSDMDDDIDDDEEMEDDYEDEEEEVTKRNDKRNKKSSYNSSSSSRATKRNNSDNSATNTANKISSFLDMTFWRKEKICCGIIFRGPDNELLIYPKLFRPCCQRNNNNNNNKDNISNSNNNNNNNNNNIKPKINANGGTSDCGSVVSSMIEDDASSNASSSNISLI